MPADIASWLVKAKVSPPTLPRQVCRREGLLQRVAAEADKRLVVLDAPAGFGKTLLLSQLHELYGDRDCRVAWLTVDETDEPNVFVPYMAFAFHRCGVDMAETGLMSSAYHGTRIAYSLGRFLSRLESAPAECVLILDDAERMRPDTVDEVLNALLRLQPDNLRVCIAFRSNPGIRLSHRRIRDEVVTLLPADLRFTRSEIGRWFGGNLDEPLLDALLKRTEGWPVALQLVRSGADREISLSEQVSRLPWADREPGTYVKEQLLSRLDASEAQFLRETSILESVRFDLADAIRNATDSPALMQRLHARLEGLFAPLKEDAAYRLHPLIRECLVKDLAEQSPRQFRDLHRSAAEWLARHDAGVPAMRHALQAEAPELAAEIFERMGAAQLWLREGMARLSTALTLLRDHELAAFPRVQIARSLHCAKNGAMRQARRALEGAKATSRGFRHDRPGGDDTALLIDGHFIDLLLTEYGCAPTADALADRTWNDVLDYARENPALHAYIMTWRCLINVQSGDFEDALRYGNKAIDDFRCGDSRYGELFIYLHFGMVELARGRPAPALDQYAKAVRIHRSELPGDAGIRMICNIALGEACWERGDFAGARRYLRQVAKQVRHAEAWFDLYMAAYSCSVRYLWLEAGLDAAREYLQAAREHAATEDLPRLAKFIDATELLLFCDAGLDREARQLVNRRGEVLDPRLGVPDRITWRELEAFCLARSRAAEIEDRHDLAERHIAALEAFGERTGNVRLQIESALRRSRLRQAAGDRGSALAALERAVVLAEPGGYGRPFIDERSRLGELLEALCRQAEADGAEADSGPRHFLAGIMAASPQDRPSPAGAGLSSRELEIIAELSSGRPDKLIARAVGLSAHGVRYHLKNIYAKLGVTNRVQAVARARHLGLLQ